MDIWCSLSLSLSRSTERAKHPVLLFEKLVEKEETSEICRLFAATLQLANHGNVEIIPSFDYSSSGEHEDDSKVDEERARTILDIHGAFSLKLVSAVPVTFESTNTIDLEAQPSENAPTKKTKQTKKSKKGANQQHSEDEEEEGDNNKEDEREQESGEEPKQKSRNQKSHEEDEEDEDEQDEDEENKENNYRSSKRKGRKRKGGKDKVAASGGKRKSRKAKE